MADRHVFDEQITPGCRGYVSDGSLVLLDGYDQATIESDAEALLLIAYLNRLIQSGVLRKG